MLVILIKAAIAAVAAAVVIFVNADGINSKALRVVTKIAQVALVVVSLGSLLSIPLVLGAVVTPGLLGAGLVSSIVYVYTFLLVDIVKSEGITSFVAASAFSMVSLAVSIAAIPSGTILGVLAGSAVIIAGVYAMSSAVNTYISLTYVKGGNQCS